MKRILFFLFGLIITNSVYSQPPVSATFEVDLSLYSGTYSNVEFYRGGQLYSMVNTNNDIYEYTVTVPSFQASNYSYKFVVDGALEYFNGTESCIGIIASDTLRIINLSNTTPSVVCWEICNSCPTAISGCTDSTANNYSPIFNINDGSCEYNVTFYVDMSEVIQSFITPEVYGSFNNWCGGCAVMTDFNNDSIWEITISLTEGSYEYKFAADNVTIDESLYESDDCVNTAFGFSNRTLDVIGDQVLDTVCWNRCYSCDTERNFYNVTFKVNMSNIVGSYTAPEVNGTFNGWCGSCWSLSPQGNNIYSRSFNIDTSLHTFKFSSDNWNIEENLDSALSCVDLGFDSIGTLQFVNRSLRAISDTILDVCWESCNACFSGCTNPIACNYNPLAIVDDGLCDLPNGCGDPGYLEYSTSVTCSDVSACFTPIVNGCTNLSACNYNLLANVDDASCDLPNGCGDPGYLEYSTSVTCSDVSACITPIVNGCTNLSACNYNQLANVDDGSCFTVYGCMNLSAINYNSLANCSDTCIFPQITYGCTDSIAINYNPTATIDDTSCIYCFYGCIDSTACNYDVLVTCDDGSCLSLYGCTDSIACNYDVLATCDDGSCLSLYGCTDSIACNYNLLATCDDGSCLSLYGCLDSLAFNYDSLANCNDITSCLYEFNITFQLDLRNQTSISYIVPELNGSFNSWCGNCAQMTDLNNDSIWEITIPILEGSGPVSGVPGWEYKFSADNWNIQENLFSGDPCVFSAFGYSNRFINVTKDSILDPVCWQSCNDCYVPQTAYNVTFRLDMNNNSNFSLPEINGEFNSWCGNCWPMSDDDGDNIWEFKTLIDTALHEYKFSADNWGTQEQLDSSASCAFTTIDSVDNIFVNRYLHINSDTLLDVVCWNECDACVTATGLIPNLIPNLYTIYPNPSTGIFYVKSYDKIDKIVLYNILNKKIFEISDPDIFQRFDISNINSNILFLEIYINDKVIRDKLIITK